MTEIDQNLQNVVGVIDRMIEEDFNIMRMNKKYTKIRACSINRVVNTRAKLNDEIIREMKEPNYVGYKIVSNGRSCGGIVNKQKIKKIVN